MMSIYAYRKHNEYVLQVNKLTTARSCRIIILISYKQKAPKSQLHIVDFEKGWTPFCEFLGVPVPDVPFPHLNKKGSITKEMIDKHPIFKKVKIEACITLAILILCIGFVISQIFN